MGIEVHAAYDLPWDCPGTYGKNKRKNVKGYEPFPQWPIKLSRISAVAPYFHNGHLLLAVDCSAFAYGNFHASLTRGKVALICCPGDHPELIRKKLLDILRLNDIASITLVRMDAPCCSGIARLVLETIKASKKSIPLRITTVFVEGEIIE